LENIKLKNAIIEVQIINKNEIEFIIGVLPSLTCKYKFIGNVVSEPIKKSVVLKFSKLIKNATAAAPISAGFKKGITIKKIV
jgi:hypothetical protein